MMAGHNHEANAPRSPHTLRRPTMRVILTTLAMLLSVLLAAAAADKDERLTPERRRELEKKAQELSDEGARQYQRGNLSKAKQLFREALGACGALYPKDKYPNGHPELATCIGNLAYLHEAAGEYGKAEPLLL